MKRHKTLYLISILQIIITGLEMPFETVGTLLLAYQIIFMYSERPHSLNRTIYKGIISYTNVPVHHERTITFRWRSLPWTSICYIYIFTWFGVAVTFDLISSLKLLRDLFSVPVLNLGERLCVKEALVPLTIIYKPLCLKRFPALSISNTGACWYTFTSFLASIKWFNFTVRALRLH